MSQGTQVKGKTPHGQSVDVQVDSEGRIIVADSNLPPTYTIRIDEGETYTYIGYATPGASEGDAVWRVKRLTNADNTIVFADGDANFDNVYADRATLSYN